MKKSLLTIALMLTAIAAGAKVYQPGDDLSYEYNDEEQTATVIPMRDTYKQDEYHIAYYNTYRGDIVIPETAPNGYTVVAIGDNAFQRTRDSRFESDHFPTITSISIPKTVKKIGNYAFSRCDSLKAFTILSTIEEIGNCVFDYSGITKITIEDTALPLHIGGGTFSDCTTFGGEFKALQTIYVGRNITCKDNKGPFQFSSNATDITYGPKVTQLNKKEAWRNKVVKNIKFNSPQIAEIPDDAFGECSALESITLPENLVTIGKSTFLWCKALVDAVLPPTVKTIASQAFSGCPLSSEYTIPASVEEIGATAFNSSAITNLTIADSDNTLTTANYSMFGGMFASPATIYAGRNIVCAEADKGPFQFAGNIEGITYGPRVTQLNVKEFWRCKSIKNVTIKSTAVTTIPVDAFSECSALETAVLPASITSVGNGAFWCDKKLVQIYANPIVPPTCGNSVFTQVDKEACTLFVPRGSLDAYKEAPVWKEFFNIEEQEETKCASPTATLEDGRLKFNCDTKGVTFHYEYSYPKGGKGTGDEVDILQTVTVSVYATRPGLEDSDIAVYELTIAGGGTGIIGDVNGDGMVNVADISRIITIMAKN